MVSLLANLSVTRYCLETLILNTEPTKRGMRAVVGALCQAALSLTSVVGSLAFQISVVTWMGRKRFRMGTKKPPTAHLGEYFRPLTPNDGRLR